MYDEGPDGKDADYLKRFVISGHSSYITKRELQEHQDKLRMQKEEYERRN